MNQYEILKNIYLQLKNKLSLLEVSGLTTEQKKQFDDITATLADLETHLLDKYINFEEICDNLPDAIYVADKDGKTIYVNEVYSQLSGISREEVIGENVHRINREKKLYTNGVIPSLLKNPRRTEQIGIMNRTDTKVYITGFPIFDENQQLKYAVAHDRNIQQLEIVKDQLIKLKEAQSMKESEIEYLRTQQMKQVELVFKSPQMYQALSTAMAVAPTDATVLITGESGTGKEVITNQIYQASKRCGQPFLKLNCAAIPETLMESELFGYTPGSFTGANKNGKTGIFELANHGTLMLDEIGEMSMPMQTKLLRVLQNHEITKIGGTQPIPVDVRIISATNRDLLECIKEKTFREDLYYRLNVVPIKLAPLRERKEDIEILIQHFLSIFNKKYNKQIEIYSDALHLMEAYNWPGNIRELENVIERLVVINNNNVIDKKTVTMVLGLQVDTSFNPIGDSYDIKAATSAVERHLIERALNEFSSKRKAAAALGIDHSTLIKKCQRYGI